MDSGTVTVVRRSVSRMGRRLGIRTGCLLGENNIFADYVRQDRNQSELEYDGAFMQLELAHMIASIPSDWDFFRSGDRQTWISPDGSQAVELFYNGTYVWRKSGDFHREGGPAVVYTEGSKYWYVNGMRHREDGPAEIQTDGTEVWWIYGARLTKRPGRAR